jgi:hypothetical protein
MVSIKSLIVLTFAALAIAAPAGPIDSFNTDKSTDITKSFNTDKSDDDTVVDNQGSQAFNNQAQKCANDFTPMCCNNSNFDKGGNLIGSIVPAIQCQNLVANVPVGVLGGALGLVNQKDGKCSQTVTCCQKGNRQQQNKQKGGLLNVNTGDINVLNFECSNTQIL